MIKGPIMSWFKNMTAKELLQYVGDIKQIAGATSSILNDGPGFNSRICEVNTAAGLSFTVLPDRGMDISACRYKGIPIAPISKVGIRNPESVNNSGYEFLKNFHCGLLTTCGLTHIGPPSTINGLHGPFSNLRTENFSINEFWDDDDYIIQLNGKIRQAVFFSENIQLQRTITTSLKSSSFTITDTITNQAFRHENIQLLYHINFGYPLLSPDATIKLPTVTTLPRDEVADKGLAHFLDVLPPQAIFDEQVYFHRPKPEKKCRFRVENKTIGIALDCQFDSTELPYLTQWNQFGQNEYVLGIEPGLGWPMNKPEGGLILAPLESFTTSLHFDLSNI